MSFASPLHTRRTALLFLATAVLAKGRPVLAAPKHAITVAKDPNCGCCGAWVKHIEANGFVASVQELRDMKAVKARLGVPSDLASCHTAEVAGYVVEGHVPASAILRLLSEKPVARGLAVPGMPIGSPGMEGGTPETYEVILFGAAGKSVFARYRGGDLI